MNKSQFIQLHPSWEREVSFVFVFFVFFFNGFTYTQTDLQKSVSCHFSLLAKELSNSIGLIVSLSCWKSFASLLLPNLLSFSPVFLPLLSAFEALQLCSGPTELPSTCGPWHMLFLWPSTVLTRPSCAEPATSSPRPSHPFPPRYHTRCPGQGPTCPPPSPSPTPRPHQTLCLPHTARRHLI